MIDHPFKAHEAWKDRDMCEERIDSGDGSGMTSACCLPRRAHPTAEALRIAELADILARVSDALTECGYTDTQAREAAVAILDSYAKVLHAAP